MRNMHYLIMFTAVLTAALFVPQPVVSEEEAHDSEKRSSFILPVFMYSTDTGLGTGVAAIKGYNQELPRLSSVRYSLIYTTKKQIVTGLGWDHYFPGDGRLSFGANYEKFPTYFYGVGNNTKNDVPEKYTPEFTELSMFYEKQLRGKFRVKTHFYLRNQALIKSEPGRLLDTSAVPWSSGRLDAGPGFSILWDSRDNILATNTGFFAQLEYRGIMLRNEGGAYNQTLLDVRNFKSLGHDVIFASMLTWGDARGDIPFYSLPYLGGNDRLRGYEYGRFRDQSLILMQQDVRFPLWGSFGGAVFASTGRVAEESPALFAGTWHTALGAGVRWIFNKEDNLVIRFDYAKGSDTSGFYITFGEAF